MDVIKHEQYKPLCEVAGDAKNILDLGANVGYASYYFAKRFPESRIVAVEPVRANMDLALLNTLGLNVSLLLGAAWSHNGLLDLDTAYKDKKEWAIRTVEGDGDIQGFIMDELICGEEIDILKMDIEGAEFEVFKDTSFLDRVRTLGIEIHEDLGDPELIYSALRNHGFCFTKHGEVVVASK